MAKRNASGGNGESAATTEEVFRPGAGYRRESSVTDAPWVAQQKGNVVEGKLLGRYEMNVDEKRYYYQVELDRPCKARQGTGEEAEIIDVPAGTVVNLNENHNVKRALTERIIPEILAGAEYNIAVAYGDKIKLGGGRTMWKIEVWSKMRKAPIRPVSALPASMVASTTSDEGPPF